MIKMPITDEQKELANDAKAWPFQEARAILKRIKNKCPEKGYVLFETGYGPSGLPHIGTFGEVARTTMVRRAFEVLSDIPTKLIAFSDDMDGMRKVPDNIPEKDMLENYIGQPLTKVPDPFGTHNSFGEHNNARLQVFLDEFGFDYEFKSATETYKSGEFDETLLLILQNYEKVTNVILPTLGEERRATYSPFLPVCPDTGAVLQVPVTAHDAAAGTITYKNEAGANVTVPVTGGACKMQWKVDWAMRWVALGVDYEMSGKDLIDSVKLSSAITRILESSPPQSFTYELFLDDEGHKISKSIGNGISMEEWLRYAPPESLSQFMYQKPTQAKRLFFDVIPKNVDEYLQHVSKFPEQDAKTQLGNPAFHIHNGTPPVEDAHISYNILLNLASVVNTEDKAVLWHFISRYVPEATPENAPTLDKLTEYAVSYFQDFIKPHKQYRAPDELERAALEDLLKTLGTLPVETISEDIQTEVYSVGKRHDFEDLKAWFKCLYEILLGQSTGPRMGSFIALYGLEETKTLIQKVLDGEALD
ncbi:MAG: lysine--tRNA ligase [Rhodospirillaceae bacterium]|jgi:lysyl-tRNA synthetase, class I|nr:lysine--tRNA ligase [Rhodospirillaceae bacterium]MBT4589601.1 lysine--tRNA ligase [Rhodospirillaceae bacterium]MBT4940144.1 lysine--tRNA ligase [Rhodospirillaceae bacterium]MBT7266873.1 lysine--tRNA ligase [Rhodospirillaceae bacterium]